MRVILDTNMLVSALISPGGAPDRLYRAWKERRFELATSLDQLAEFRRVTRYPKRQRLIEPVAAGEMYNQLAALAYVPPKISRVEHSPDPADNFLLGIAEVTEADYLVTGDRRGLLDLKTFGRTHIVTPRTMIDIIG
jgi:putative PIN family toxin of toxin-antitoxin system